MTQMQQKIGKELMDLIMKIKIEYMKKGKKPPSVREITNKIAKKIGEDNKTFQEIISFK
jgi:sulfur relay (sulfurtransferase) DsrC/TusE family protein